MSKNRISYLTFVIFIIIIISVTSKCYVVFINTKIRCGLSNIRSMLKARSPRPKCMNYQTVSSGKTHFCRLQNCSQLIAQVGIDQRVVIVTVIVIQYNTIQYNTIQYNTIQYNTIQYNTIQYNTTQHNTIQYNSIQYNTIQLYCPGPGY